MKIRCGRGIMKYCCQSSRECSHWIELPMVDFGKKTPKIIGHCTDWFDTQLKWDNNRIQVGQQKSMDSIRNRIADSNRIAAKVIQFIAEAITRKQIIMEYKTKELLEKPEGEEPEGEE